MSKIKSLEDFFASFPTDRVIHIDTGDYQLKLTCSACPEQYDVFKDGKQVGYLRLRHGHFYASIPDVDGKTVYEGYPNGDGSFEEDERKQFLTEAIIAIDSKTK